MARIAVIGAGPAGLLAAERLAGRGHAIVVYDRMPTAARKLLMAGRGGLNLTHSEPLAAFLTRYGEAERWLAPMIRRWTPADLVAWANGLGQETFVGTSGRVFPRAMKASPLLRAWLARLAGQGVELRTGVRWTGFGEVGPRWVKFVDAAGATSSVEADAVVLALGGASWPRLGSDGAWASILRRHGVCVAPMRSSNMGLAVAWSEPVRRFAGTPLKRIALSFGGRRQRGEAIVTAAGIEGGAVYALSAAVRDALEDGDRAVASPIHIEIDLRPDLDQPRLAARLAAAGRKQSLATVLRKAAGLPPAAVAVLREGHGNVVPREADRLAEAIKAVPLRIAGVAGLERAISSAGGVTRDSVDERLMLRALPGVFVAGEMLDWEAPTGGYLLQGVLATAVVAADGAEAWLAERHADR